MATPKKPLSRDAIFRMVRSEVGGSLGRTLTECLYWSQYAQYVEDGRPIVWKTGAELGQELGCNPRTANEHLKKLRFMGFWDIEYKPRPGRPSVVTWLHFTDLSLSWLQMARRLRDDQPNHRRKHGKAPVEVAECALSTHTDDEGQQSGFLTSKHNKTSPQTSPGQKKDFFLTKEQKAVAGKKEPSPKFSEGSQGEVILKAPKYAKASEREEAFAASIRAILVQRDLKEWDWSSAFTWQHLKAICGHLKKVGLTSDGDWSAFFSKVLENWEWLRCTMEPRYSSFDGNLHRPTPMALAAEISTLHSALIVQESKPLQTYPTYSLDEDF